MREDFKNDEKIQKKEGDKPLVKVQLCRDRLGRFTAGNQFGKKGVLPENIKNMLKSASLDAINFIIDTMNNPNEKTNVRLACAENILERVYGKASQPIEGGVDTGVRFVLSSELKDYAK